MHVFPNPVTCIIRIYIYIYIYIYIIYIYVHYIYVYRSAEVIILKYKNYEYCKFWYTYISCVVIFVATYT